MDGNHTTSATISVLYCSLPAASLYLLRLTLPVTSTGSPLRPKSATRRAITPQATTSKKSRCPSPSGQESDIHANGLPVCVCLIDSAAIAPLPIHLFTFPALSAVGRRLFAERPARRLELCKAAAIRLFQDPTGYSCKLFPLHFLNLFIQRLPRCLQFIQALFSTHENHSFLHLETVPFDS